MQMFGERREDGCGGSSSNLNAHILQVFTFQMLTFWLLLHDFFFFNSILNTRSSSSLVWQMVPLRCDYECAVWGRGRVRVINALTMIYRTANLNSHTCSHTRSYGAWHGRCFTRPGVWPKNPAAYRRHSYSGMLQLGEGDVSRLEGPIRCFLLETHKRETKEWW